MTLREMIREGAADLVGATRPQRICNVAIELGCSVAVRYDPTISELGKNVLSGSFALAALVTVLWPIRGSSPQSSNSEQQ